MMGDIAKISDSILKKIKDVVKDEKEQRLLLDLLDCEIRYLDVEEPDFHTDYKNIIEQRFPHEDAN